MDRGARGEAPRILDRGSSNERTSQALVEARLFQRGRTEYKEYTARSGAEEDKENGSRGGGRMKRGGGEETGTETNVGREGRDRARRTVVILLPISHRHSRLRRHRFSTPVLNKCLRRAAVDR